MIKTVVHFIVRMAARFALFTLRMVAEWGFSITTWFQFSTNCRKTKTKAIRAAGLKTRQRNESTQAQLIKKKHFTALSGVGASGFMSVIRWMETDQSQNEEASRAEPSYKRRHTIFLGG